MKKINFILLLPFILLISSAAYALSPGDQLNLSFPLIHLQQGERVVEFDLTVTTGQVIAISEIPKDWSINLAAEQSAEALLKGGCVHGAGALRNTTELPQFTIKVDKPFDETSPKFSAKAKIRVTADFEKTREIAVVPELLAINKDRKIQKGQLAMWNVIVSWFDDSANTRVIISNFVLPVCVGILAFLASNSIGVWRTRKRQSLLGAAVCSSLIEELNIGIGIMKDVQAVMDNSGQATGSLHLPRKSWSGMNTISDDVLERLLCIVEKKPTNRGFPIKEIKIHLKNYFEHMCSNFDSVTVTMCNGGNWQQQAQVYLVQSKYLEAAEKVLAMLEDAQEYLEENCKKLMPR